MNLGFKPSVKIYEKNFALLHFFIPEQNKLFRNTTLSKIQSRKTALNWQTLDVDDILEDVASKKKPIKKSVKKVGQLPTEKKGVDINASKIDFKMYFLLFY